MLAEYLLNHLPDRMVRRVADTYNAAARHLGDAAPDFMAAVQDLTASACESRNPRWGVLIVVSVATQDAMPQWAMAARASSPPLEWAMIFTCWHPVSSMICWIRAASSRPLSSTEAADYC